MKLKTKLIIILFLSTIFLLLSKTEVKAKSYYIDDMNIQATIQSNGDLQIEQTLKYVFNGDYNGIYITIPTKYKNKEDTISEISDEIYNAQGVEVQNVSLVKEDNTEDDYSKVSSASNGSKGVYTEEKTNDSFKLKIYSPSQNTQKTFRVKYLLKNVCVEHNDVGELYYNFIGGEWQCSIKKLNIDIFLPNNQNDIKIWGHGPDNGTSKIVNNEYARFSVTNVATGKYVAARVIFDKSYMTNAQKKTNINAYDIIYKNEQRIAKVSDQKKSYTRNVYLFALALIVYWVILLLKYEKDTKLTMVPFDEDELFKKYNPMLAGCLQGSRDILARDIIAVILNLIEKDNIKLEIVKDFSQKNDGSYSAYPISKNKAKESEMDSIETMVYNWLFMGNDVVELSQRLKDMPKDQDAELRFKKLNDVVQEKLNNMGANKKGVPKLIRIINTFLFFFTVYLAGKHILNQGFQIYDDEYAGMVGLMSFIIFFPVVMLIIYGILSLIITVRKKVNNLINKITGQRVVTTTVTIISIFLVIIIISLVKCDIGNRYIIADEILLCISMIIMLTDNLMMKNSVKMIEDYSKINSFKDKLEDYTMMEDRDIEQVKLWGKYLAYSVSFGIAVKISKRIKGLSLDDDLLNLLNDKEIFDYILNDYSFFYYNSGLDTRFIRSYEKFMSSVGSDISSGSGGFGSGGRILWWWRIFTEVEVHGGGRRRLLETKIVNLQNNNKNLRSKKLLRLNLIGRI